MFVSASIRIRAPIFYPLAIKETSRQSTPSHYRSSIRWGRVSGCLNGSGRDTAETCHQVCSVCPAIVQWQARQPGAEEHVHNRPRPGAAADFHRILLILGEGVLVVARAAEVPLRTLF